MLFRSLTHAEDPLTRIVGAGYLIGTPGLFVQLLTDPMLEYSVLVLLWFLSGLVEGLDGRPRSMPPGDARPSAAARFKVSDWLGLRADSSAIQATQ